MCLNNLLRQVAKSEMTNVITQQVTVGTDNTCQLMVSLLMQVAAKEIQICFLVSFYIMLLH
jgi:hypothetical protein